MPTYKVSLVYRPPGDPDPETGDLPALEDTLVTVTASTPYKAVELALALHANHQPPFCLAVAVCGNEWWFDIEDGKIK